MQKKIQQKTSRSSKPKVQEAQESFQKRMLKIRLGNSFIQAKVKADFYLARCNMILDGIEEAQKNDSKYVRELIDGVPKSLHYSISEYRLIKVSAIQAARQSYFDKVDFLKEGFTEEELAKFDEEYFGKGIVRDTYDDEFRRERLQDGFVRDQ